MTAKRRGRLTSSVERVKAFSSHLFSELGRVVKSIRNAIALELGEKWVELAGILRKSNQQQPATGAFARMTKSTYRILCLTLFYCGGMFGHYLPRTMANHVSAQQIPNVAKVFLSFSSGMTKRSLRSGHISKQERLAYDLLYTNLDALGCGIPLRIAMCKHTFLMKCSSVKGPYIGHAAKDDLGAVFIAEVTKGGVVVFLSNARPNRTTIFRISENYECRLLFDSFKLDEPLRQFHTTMACIGSVGCNDDKAFILREIKNATLDQLSAYPRVFQLTLVMDHAQIEILDYIK